MVAMADFTHLDGRGRVKMVDVGEKAATVREAVARGEIRMRPATLQRILNHEIAKGEVLTTARLAGIMAAKQTDGLIPLCHPLNLAVVEINFRAGRDEGCLEIQARARMIGPTGVEMEALTAVSVAALTVYDMCKAVERGMMIGNIRLVYKSGGRSGTFIRDGEENEWPDAL